MDKSQIIILIGVVIGRSTNWPTSLSPSSSTRLGKSSRTALEVGGHMVGIARHAEEIAREAETHGHVAAARMAYLLASNYTRTSAYILTGEGSGHPALISCRGYKRR
jgi:tartrate dehydratase beta subunit/fumarate hydratase class I family protein